jgi:hypothetical protein
VVGHHARGAVHADPPELAPVHFVVVDEDGHGRVGGEVLQALEVCGSLGLGVDREIQGVAIDHKCDRDEVRPRLRIGGGEVRHPRAGEVLAYRRGVHPTKYR